MPTTSMRRWSAAAPTVRSRRKIPCRPTGSAGNISSASTKCATATCRRRRAASICIAVPCSASLPSALRADRASDNSGRSNMTAAKHVAVLGGAGGIGRALVAALSARGDDVVVLDLPASLERHRPSVDAIAVDIHSEASIEAAMRALAARSPSLDGFVNLAGYNSMIQPLAETGTDYFDDILSGNLRGVFLSTRAVLPLLADNASVVTVASGLAHYIRPGHGSY